MTEKHFLAAAATKFEELPVSARILVLMFGLAGVAEVFFSLRSGPASPIFLFMLALAVVTARAKVKLPGGSTLSVLTSVVLAAMMLLGTRGAIIVGVLGAVVQSSFPWKKRVGYRILFNAGMIATTVFLARLGYVWVASDKPEVSRQLAGMLMASFIYYVCNSTSVSLILSLTSGSRVWTIWRSNFLFTAPAFLLAGVVSFAAAQMAAE